MRLALGNLERDRHPVDLVEQVANGHDWSFERTAKDEITISVEGQWTNYHVAFSWIENQEALHLACAFDIAVSKQRQKEFFKLVLCINEKLLMGHFDFWEDSSSVIFRQALLLSGGLRPSDTQVETLLVNALDVCETHYSAFQMVAWSSLSAENALQFALFETKGNA